MIRLLAAEDNIKHTIDLGATQPGGVAKGTEISVVINNAIVIIMVVGALGVLFFIAWGALEWTSSGGDKEKVGNARKRITSALIGLAFLALTFLLVAVVGRVVGLNPLKTMSIPTLGGAKP